MFNSHKLDGTIPDKLLLYKKLLKDNFQYNDFKIDQRKVIESFIAGKNTLAIMPTGYGKSICFQIPALDVGRTLVISPLIALMSDQVNSLKEKGIGAEYINSSNRKSHNKILHDFKNNKIKILYIAPERFDNELFIKEIKNIDINLFVVDEAHCIVDWGPDFRPNYSSLDNYINELNSPNEDFTNLSTDATKKYSTIFEHMQDFNNNQYLRIKYEYYNFENLSDIIENDIDVKMKKVMCSLSKDVSCE